ncbi:MAG TPA: EF-hand domain-containing protein [Caulobacteraceae bacterium]|jgi:hypothetical protein|nr:EF-hand domain-containing protein [Caulobacteraceae bacterium]
MNNKAWAPAAAAIVLLLGGCASEPSPPAPGLGGPQDGVGGRGGAELNLFISPAGKPYRGRAGEPYPSAAWFAQADKDHDGRLSLEEFRADSLAFFRELDTDHNGVVDGFEVMAYEQSLPEILPRVQGLRPGEGMNPNLGRAGPGQRDENRGGGGGGGGGRGGAGAANGRQGAGLFGFLDQPEPVTVADTDFDSHITLAEAQAAADRRFAILDTNRDGFLTLAELPKTPVQAFAERQAEQRKKRQGRP